MSTSQTNRLLYRGMLSLPDSHIILEGLSFTVNIGDVRASPRNGVDLLNNHLALALESMRGRPLRYIGVTRLQDVYLDVAGAIIVDIHPQSFLTRRAFENALCIAPIKSTDRRTDSGIRVSLSDSPESDTNDFIIYGQLEPSIDPFDQPMPSTSTSAPLTLHLRAARILPAPPPKVRLPRPDDPTPRKPPPLFSLKRKRDASASFSAGAALEKARQVMLRMPRTGQPGPKTVELLGKEARIVKDDVFKVPTLPSREVPVERNKARSQESLSLKKSTRQPETSPAEIEKANKITVKRSTIRLLEQYGIAKQHIEFNDLFQMIYRGASFALRDRMAESYIDVRTIDTFVEGHTKMYVYSGDKNGHGRIL